MYRYVLWPPVGQITTTHPPWWVLRLENADILPALCSYTSHSSQREYNSPAILIIVKKIFRQLKFTKSFHINDLTGNSQKLYDVFLLQSIFTDKGTKAYRDLHVVSHKTRLIPNSPNFKSYAFSKPTVTFQLMPGYLSPFPQVPPIFLFWWCMIPLPNTLG